MNAGASSHRIDRASCNIASLAAPSVARWKSLGSIGAAVWLLAACSFEDTRKHCKTTANCEGGQVCDRGFCVSRDETVRNPATVDQDSAVRREDAGATDAGPGTPTSAADGGTTSDAHVQMPAPDSGTVCEEGASRSCMLPGTAAERCRVGMQTCANGAFGACTVSETPRPETCDGIDEDCDGRIDEDVVEDCYPAGKAGCTLSANAAPICKGRCTLGKRTCVDGKLTACTGAITPGTEVCSTSGAAIDEDCNGSSDEICSCNQGETRDCYPASSDTLNVGNCKTGTQSCTNGMLGPCNGAVMPQTETCGNEGADDNCDGVPDNILNRGALCSVASNMGMCKSGTLQCKGAELACITQPPAAAESCNDLDDDCDGKTDEAFNLQTDSANCGACGMACAAGQTCCAGKCSNLQEDENNCGACGPASACTTGSTCCSGMCVNTMQNDTSCGACGTPCETGKTCCGGQCVDTKNDPKHCGTCTNACSMGTQPGCCGGSCVDFLSSQNCGRCGQVCGVLDGGVVCECAVTQSGTMCTSSVLGLCL